ACHCRFRSPLVTPSRSICILASRAYVSYFTLRPSPLVAWDGRRDRRDARAADPNRGRGQSRQRAIEAKGRVMVGPADIEESSTTANGLLARSVPRRRRVAAGGAHPTTHSR